MEMRHRKPNRIREYDYSQNGAYFVTICTHERRKLLSQIVGDGFPVPKPIGMLAEALILQISDQYSNVTVDHYVLMPDHIHMLLRIDHLDGTGNPSPTEGNGTGNPSPTLGTIIGWYKYQLTKQVNAQAGTQGQRLLQRSYYDHVIRNQRDYDEIWQYIENNPRKWWMEQKGID